MQCQGQSSEPIPNTSYRKKSAANISRHKARATKRKEKASQVTSSEPVPIETDRNDSSIVSDSKLSIHENFHIEHSQPIISLLDTPILHTIKVPTAIDELDDFSFELPKINIHENFSPSKSVELEVSPKSGHMHNKRSIKILYHWKMKNIWFRKISHAVNCCLS